MTKLTKIQDQILRAAADGGADGLLAAPKDWKTVSALTNNGLLTSTAIPEGGSSIYITQAGYAALEREPPVALEKPPAAPVPAAPKGKIAVLVAMLRAPAGATIDAMTTATGWQAHSVRGAMSGALKKKLGMTIVSERTEAGRVYRIVQTPAAEQGA